MAHAWARGPCVHGVLQKVVEQANREFEWRFYEYGPKSVRSPLVFLPAAGGTAESFYKIFMALSSQGFRLLAVRAAEQPPPPIARPAAAHRPPTCLAVADRCGQIDAPPYMTHEGFCDGFTLFLDQIGAETVQQRPRPCPPLGRPAARSLTKPPPCSLPSFARSCRRPLGASVWDLRRRAARPGLCPPKDEPGRVAHLVQHVLRHQAVHGLGAVPRNVRRPRAGLAGQVWAAATESSSPLGPERRALAPMHRFSWTPEFALKRYILSNYPMENLEGGITDSIDFMVEQVCPAPARGLSPPGAARADRC